MDLVETVGKLNAKVPILLTPDMKRGMDLLVETRDEVGISTSNPHMFAQVSGRSTVMFHVREEGR
jgi:hypothetical protein